MNDEHLYTKVTDELENHGLIPGLWAKAFAESNGIEPVAKALYLRYCVAQLAESERQNVETQKQTDEADAGMPIHLFFLGIILFVVILVIIMYA